MGADPRPFFVPKELLLEVPFFRGALAADRFVEGRENKIRLPEDHAHLWKMAIEFLQTGEFFPRLVETRGVCKCSARMGLFQDWGSHNHFDEAVSLEIPLRTIGRNGTVQTFGWRDQSMGDWVTDEATHLLFVNIVRLFCMAEKYASTPLMRLCLRKLHTFPIGPRAFAVLAEHCTLFENPPFECDWNEAKSGLVWLVKNAANYHSLTYKESKIRRLWGVVCDNGGNPGPYEDLDAFLEASMTPEAWTTVQLLLHARVTATSGMRSRLDPGWWSCESERQGVFQKTWNEASAVLAWLALMKREGRQWPKDAPAPELRDGDEGTNLFPGFNFAEAEPGDLITSMSVDQPAKGFVYGFVQRSARWGWFLKDNVRFLEQRSSKYCNGECHEVWTFKCDGLRLDMHDPEGRGIKFRTGRKSKGWRKTGGPKMLDRYHAVPLEDEQVHENW